MSFTLHGHPFSTCTRRVLVSAAEAGIWDSVKVQVAPFEATKTPEWLEKQPFGQMPYLVDEETGTVVYESRAIAKYLALKSKSSLIPPTSDLDAWAKFETACSVEQANFDASAYKLAYELVFGPSKGEPTNQANVESLKATLHLRLEGYERILSKSKYVAGDKLTLADLFHLPYGQMAVDLGVAPGLIDGSLPNVTRWWKEISSLPSWEKANEALKQANK